MGMARADSHGLPSKRKGIRRPICRKDSQGLEIALGQKIAHLTRRTKNPTAQGQVLMRGLKQHLRFFDEPPWSLSSATRATGKEFALATHPGLALPTATCFPCNGPCNRSR